MASKISLLLELSGEHVELPYAELEAVLGAFALREKYKDLNISTNKPTERLVIIELSNYSDELAYKLGKRLAMCHRINELVASGSVKDIEAALANLSNLKFIRNSTFKLFTHQLGNNKVWPKNEMTAIKNKIIKEFSKFARVDVNQPVHEIILYRDAELFLARKIVDLPRSEFEARKPHQRPYFAPVSLHPRLARCLVNLAGLDNNQVLLDPFCGTGGLLLEAGLMGMTVIGSDIDPQMVAGTKANLEHWGINNYSLINSDIESLAENLRKQGSAGQPHAIVTEPPYGRASTTQGQALDELLRKSFEIFSEILHPNGRLVISLPDPELAYAVHRDFKLLNRLTLRIHKSLTKTIFVFEKRE